MIGAATILSDPIFQGLAISLLSGLASSTLLTDLRRSARRRPPRRQLNRRRPNDNYRARVAWVQLDAGRGNTLS